MSNAYILASQQSAWRFVSLIQDEPGAGNNSTLVLNNSSGASVSLTGLEIVGQARGSTHDVLNAGTDPIELLANNAESIAAFRFADAATLDGGSSVRLYYNGYAWEVLSVGGGGAGAGVPEVGGELEGETPGGILFADSLGRLSQSSSAFYFDSINKTLKLVDKDYVRPFLAGGPSYFTVGSSVRFAQPAANHLVATETSLPLTLSGNTKYTLGHLLNLDIQGNPANPQIMGQWINIGTNGFFPTGLSSLIYGIYASVDLGAPIVESVGGQFQVMPSGAGAHGAGIVCGVRGIAGMGHNGDSDLANAVDAFVSSGASSPSRTALAIGLRSRMWLMPGVTATVARLISLSDTFVNTGVVENSAYIYADALFDIGTVTKYFIKSLSTSPSEWAGSLSLPSLIVTGLTTGSVPFIGAAGAVSQDNAVFFWDNTNKRLKLTKTVAGGPLLLQGEAGSYFVDVLEMRSQGYSFSAIWNVGDLSCDLRLSGVSAGAVFSVADQVGVQGLKIFGQTTYASPTVRLLVNAPAATIGQQIQLTAAQAADAFQVRTSGAAEPFVIDKNGTIGIKVNAAPADADIDANQLFFWFDPTNGSAKLKVKAKQADGTVRTGEIALA